MVRKKSLTNSAFLTNNTVRESTMTKRKTNDDRITRLERAVESLLFFQEQRVKDADEALLKLFTKTTRRAR